MSVLINHSDAKNALGAFISHINKSSSTSFWYRVYDSCKDNPEVVEIPNAKLGDNDKGIEALGPLRKSFKLPLRLDPDGDVGNLIR